MKLEHKYPELKLKKYDFLDFGTSSGGSIDYCEKHFEVNKGLGVDIAPHKVEKAKANGYDVVEMDILELESNHRFSFISMMDFLEHLPGYDYSYRILEKGKAIAKDFLFIRHPAFDDIDYLKSEGLKITWTDWSGHTNMLTVPQYTKMFNDLGLKQYAFNFRKPILNSNDKFIVPLSAPIDSLEYNEKEHGKKKSIEFAHPVYGQIDIFVALRPIDFDRWNWITREGK